MTVPVFFCLAFLPVLASLHQAKLKFTISTLWPSCPLICHPPPHPEVTNVMHHKATCNVCKEDVLISSGPPGTIMNNFSGNLKQEILTSTIKS